MTTRCVVCNAPATVRGSHHDDDELDLPYCSAAHFELACPAIAQQSIGPKVKKELTAAEKEARREARMRKAESKEAAATRMREGATPLLPYWDTKTQFMFYSGSRDERPGYGASEWVDEDEDSPAVYGQLPQRFPGWRNTLSNLYTRPDGRALFQLDGLGWNSVEHYYQAQKFVGIDDAMVRKMAIGGEFGSTPGVDARKHRKDIQLDATQLAARNARSAQVMARAQRAKFTQNPDLAELLRLTGQARLVHRPMRSPNIEVQESLMRLRYELQQQAVSSSQTIVV